MAGDTLTNTSDRGLSTALLALMATAVGSIVADLYYLQPLLHQMSKDFHVGTAHASLLMTMIQLGYAVGLALVVPLGDIIPRRRLSISIFFLAVVMLIIATFLHSFDALVAVTTILGLATVGGQVLIPFAADLARDDQRGRVIARVMTGLLVGILLSRTISGLIAQAFGWRAVYWFSAAFLLFMAGLLYRYLPSEAPRPHVPYRRLVGGVFSLYLTEPQLRRRAWFGALIFACNNVLWTPISYLLAGAPFHYSNAVIGLFGLFGLAGVLAANLAGHNADRNRSTTSTFVFATLLLASFGLLGVGQNLVVVLSLGIIALDAGMQGMQITNQSIIYSLLPGSRSRVNSAYMVSAFIGASLGSYLSGIAYEHWGWTGDCWLGAVMAALIIVPALWWYAPRRVARATSSPEKSRTTF